ncbi:DUF2071 domain-containing protein [Pollutibacter soli]|uniref:DUF2071 domain-containing protein n=1 Tax=Pollutibacter soli TaxID=3034157 RepID=UPI003013EF32
MFSGLKNHPFAVEAWFDFSLVLTFAVPKKAIAHLVPEHLTADCLHDQWAFMAVALVQTKDLRPKGFPRFSGQDFFLIGYRIFVRYTNQQGRRLRGLYILKSETDKKQMEWLGNAFTHYGYTTIDIHVRDSKEKISVESKLSGLSITVNCADADISLPTGSPFIDWKEARKFAGPLPFTFTYNKSQSEMLIVEGVREHWTPSPVKVLDFNIPFLQQPEFKDARQANAFIVRNIPYSWKKGRKEKWKI